MTGEETQIQKEARQAEIIKTLIKNQQPFALWKKPESDRLHLIVDTEKEIRQIEENLEKLPKGFVFAPFLTNGEKLNFIKADTHIIWESYLDDKETRITKNIHNSHLRLFDLHPEEEKDPHKTTLDKKNNTSTREILSEEEYITIVKKAIQELEIGELKKVVLSRKESASLPNNYSIWSHFRNLCRHNENAFVYILYIPQKEQLWIGATPEHLLKLDENDIFTTTALAGSQAHEEHRPLRETLWAQKEIEEQAMVSRYIINCFKKIRLREFEEIGPRTIRAGNILHLKTDFRVNTKEVNYPTLATEMMKLLHPTSAVCGMPKKEAEEFILSSESYNRELYSGFLGVIGIENPIELFVNLRCAKLSGNKITYFAGAGITALSNPKKEYLETQMKMNTIKRAL